MVYRERLYSVLITHRLLKTIHVELSRNSFQFLYMTLAIDITDGHGLSNEVHHEFLPKMNKVLLYLSFISQKYVASLTSSTLLTRRAALFLKSGHNQW